MHILCAELCSFRQYALAYVKPQNFCHLYPPSEQQLAWFCAGGTPECGDKAEHVELATRCAPVLHDAHSQDRSGPHCPREILGRHRIDLGCHASRGWRRLADLVCVPTGNQENELFSKAGPVDRCIIPICVLSIPDCRSGTGRNSYPRCRSRRRSLLRLRLRLSGSNRRGGASIRCGCSCAVCGTETQPVNRNATTKTESSA